MKQTILTMLMVLIVFPAFTQTAREIVQKSMNAVETGDMEMTSTIRIQDGRGNERVRQISTASRRFGDCSKMLTVFQSPADVKGTALLVHDYDKKEDNMWIYMPALRRVRRIVSSDKSKNFMGSEFTNADMAKPNIDEYQYKDLGTDNFSGKKVRKIESIPVNDQIAKENNISKKISYFDTENYLCYRIEYYDLSGKVHRTQTISDYKKLSNGRYFAHRMEMENMLNGRKTIMTVDRFQLGSSMPENRFTPNALEQ